MKTLKEKILKTNTKAFTLIEMLIVLLIISVLLLLFVPNLSKQKDSVTKTGNQAIVKVVESQKELYAIANPTAGEPSAETLASEGYITNDQLETYNNHVAGE
ncbi:competence type IV pilus major pilin ComGC [Streptococcus moroccensis]|uniref:Competence protein ComGC n=1 Tax=Streptococcus moroccensis TaxID=1451356 RepID=A0ABT9YSF4_9STRE|nr:competence type IV pilus major pilin ComGC [Streptococcus moroccensis]MDQ0222931.1 competence protein ComGC [Streptococcus moroccensis]